MDLNREQVTVFCDEVVVAGGEYRETFFCWSVLDGSRQSCDDAVAGRLPGGDEHRFHGAKARKTLSSWANPPSAKPTSHSHCSTPPADRKDYTAKFFRTDTLANHLAVLKHGDIERMKFLEELHTADVLVLDDFLTTPIDAATAHQLLTILAERELVALPPHAVA